MNELETAMRQFNEQLREMVPVFTEWAGMVAMSFGLTLAERWVAGLPRRHYADPELTEPAGTEGER